MSFPAMNTEKWDAQVVNSIEKNTPVFKQLGEFYTPKS